MQRNNEFELQNLLNDEDEVTVNVSGIWTEYERRIQKMSRWLPFLVLSSLLVLFYIINSVGSFKAIKHVDSSINSSTSVWTYQCTNEKCIKRRMGNYTNIVTLETCNMLCSTPSLWPKPTTLRIHSKSSSIINKDLISFTIEAVDRVKTKLHKATNIFLNNFPSVHVMSSVYEFKKLRIVIEVREDEIKPKITTNESYSLMTKTTGVDIAVQITAASYFGARHALETLSQLIWFDKVDQKMRILHDITIEDSPAFPHRGLMIDTARNYFHVEELLKVLDGMAATKLNVFHLHLTDSVSFPLILPNNPNFAMYGAYSPEMVYTPEDIKGIIDYANIRGIRVILEIDAPSHVNEGWNYADTDTDKLVICGKDNVFNGHLNPDNNRTLIILRSIYEDLLYLIQDGDIFHIGGDEVTLKCYRDTKRAEKYSDMYLFWADFTNEMFDTVKLANHNLMPKHLVIWSSPLTDYYLSSLKYQENLVIQYWFGEFAHILQSGYKIIFSTVGEWYLDCGFGSWKPNMTNGVCDPYTPWQKFYKYRPWNNYEQYINQILGGEACLWTEQVDVDSLHTRIWPRTAALAERLWSDPLEFNDYDVSTRLANHKERLQERGIKVAAMWPRWCSQNPGKC